MLTFVLAMALYPEVQAKLHAELRNVLCGMRLPAIQDRTALPYTDAAIKETLRWQPVAPLGVPHTSIAEDVYEGYCIPSG